MMSFVKYTSLVCLSVFGLYAVGSPITKFNQQQPHTQLRDTAPKTPNQRAYIALDGDVLYYQGMIDDYGLDTVKDLYETANPKPSILHINSTGGIVKSGMAMGDWVAENNLNIKITGLCFSSCANYVFPVAHKKYIGHYAVIGWHGDPVSSDYFSSKYQGVSPEQAVREYLIKKALKEGKKPNVDEIEKLVQQAMEATKNRGKSYTDFYDKHKLSPQIPRTGHMNDTWAKQLHNTAHYKGWTYTPTVMAQLGIDAIVLTDGTWIYDGTTQWGAMKPDLLLIDTLNPVANTSLKPTRDWASAYVFLKGDTLYYQGAVDTVAFETMKNLYETANPKPTILHINSGGGEVNIGMEMGHWVAEKQLDIMVTDMCFSSCANYIFPVAHKKYIGHYAVIGWHGDPVSTDAYQNKYKNQNLEDSLRRALLKSAKEQGHTFTKNELEQAIADNIAHMKKNNQKYDDFYHKYGLSPHIPRVGHVNEPWAEKLHNSDVYKGWTYTPDVMKQLGIDNVIFIDDTWIFKDDPEKAHTASGSKVLLIDSLQ